MFAAGKAVSGATPTDAQFNYVTMLLHGDGTNGAQNNTFVDSSTNNFTITRNGNTTQGTFSPYGSNWSNYFGGSDYITLSSAPISATGAFTFECWVFVTGTASSQAIYGQYLGANSGRFNMFWNDVANKFSLSIATTSYDSASTYSANTWYHIAWVRDGSNNLSLYVNGVRDFTTTGVSTSLYTGNPIIAARASGATPYTGYISNMRITNTAVYSGTSFTVPTTPLTNISGTTLLTCQSNRFVDNETTPLTFTISGSPSVQRFSPFSPTSAYSTSVIGGSGYFDGSGDYLSVASNAAFDVWGGNFTLEMFVYLTATPSNVVFFQWGSGTYLMQLEADSVGGSFFGTYYYSAPTETNSIRSSTVPGINQWNHIALTKSGSTWALFLNGTRLATTTSTNYVTGSLPIYIGANNSGGQPLQGYISNLRLVKGTAVYDPSVSTLTVPTAPLTAITNTSLLLSTTNAAILDNAMMSDLETVGNAQISTSVKKYGTGSMYFDGTGDGLVARSTPDTAFGTGDFTVEFWINLAANLGSFVKIIQMGTTGNCLTVETQSTTNVLNVSNYTSTVYLASSTALTTSTWIHVAVTRASGTLRIFQNGTQTGSVANTVDFPNAGGIYIGQSSTGQAMNGYIDDLRITKGVARYTSNFTAPTAPFPDRG